MKLAKNESDKVFDFLLYKNHYALKKKLNVFLVNHLKIFICRRCLNSYTSENMLTLHKPKCENCDMTTIRISPESHLHWKNHFHKYPLCFKINADFEVDNEIDNSSTGFKTPNFYKQNPVCDGYYITSELEDV